MRLHKINYIFLICLVLVPEPPAGLKSLLLPTNMALISWIPPKQPNGQIQHYTLYEREVIIKFKYYIQNIPTKITRIS